MQRRIQIDRVAIAFSVLVLACSKSDAPRVDSSATPRALVATAAPAGLPGALSKAIGEYSGDEFFAFVNKLAYVGGVERTRTCKNAQGCGAGGRKTTSVFIEAIDTQDSLGAGNVPRFGVVYGRAANRGDAQEARYGFLTGKQFQYFFVITPDSATGMKVHVMQLLSTPGTNKLTEVSTGTFRGCGHAWKAGAHADFKTCAESAAMHDSVVRLGLLLQDGDSPAWFECASGCCWIDET